MTTPYDDFTRTRSRQPEALPPGLRGNLNALELFKGVWRRWPVALAAGAAAGTAAAAAAYFGVPPPKHSARALIHVAADVQRVLFDTREARPDFGTFRATQMALVRSRLVLNAALRDRKLAAIEDLKKQPDPLAWLEKQVRVANHSSPEILAVSMSSDRPEEAKVVVDAVVRAYLDEVVNKEDGKRHDRLEQLRKFHADHSQNLDKKRAALRDKAEGLGSQDSQVIALRQKNAQEEYGRTRSELLQIQSELRRAEVELKSLQSHSGRGGASASLVEQAIADDPALARLRAAQKAAGENYRAALAAAVRGAADPVVQRWAREAAEAGAELARREKEYRDGADVAVRDTVRREQDSRLRAASDRVELLRAHAEKLDSDLRAMNVSNDGYNRRSLDLDPLRADITQAEDVVRRLNEEAERLKIELQAPRRVVLLEEGVIDLVDVTARRLQLAGLAFLGALGGVALLVGWWESRARRVDSVESLEEGLGLKVVGALPDAGGRRSYRAGVALEEAVSAARTMLLHTAETDGVKVVLVTSAVAGEGKSTLAAHLAASLAGAGRATLLIDCDLRKPSLHEVMEAAAAPGVCEVVRREVSVLDAIQATGHERLSVVAAGHPDGDAFRRVAQDGARQLFATARRQYDFVVVDASPVLPVADALVFAQQADAVILSVRSGKSQLHRVHEAARKLGRLGVRVLGAVVCGTKSGVKPYASTGATSG